MKVPPSPLVAGRPIGDLLREFAELRQKSLAEFRSLPPDLDAAGTHPEFGRVTLREMLASWVVHDMAHNSSRWGSKPKPVSVELVIDHKEPTLHYRGTVTESSENTRDFIRRGH